MNYIGLDLSTKTGFVKLSPDGEVLEQTEIRYPCDSPCSMIDMVEAIMGEIEYGCAVCLEGFSYGSKGNAVDIQYGLGWLVRVALFERGTQYYIVPPTTVKKFASGKGTMKKDALAVEIYKRWGFEHDSDNVRDAYILAQMSRGIHLPIGLTKFQQEAIQAVLGKGNKK